MPPTMYAIGAAVGAAAGAYTLYVLLSPKKKLPKRIKLTYFDMPATPGEKVRLALVLTVGKSGFTDDRIKGADWSKVKEERQPRYGQMPIMSLDGDLFYQSSSMLRYVGSELGDGSLYPMHDAALRMKIEEILGLSDDLQRAWMPNLYVGMRPTWAGYPKDWAADAKAAKVKEMRENFVATELPKYCAFLETHLKETGAFLAGPTPTIADCQLLPQLAYFTRGAADHVPTTVLDGWPEIKKYLARMLSLPAVKDWYGL